MATLPAKTDAALLGELRQLIEQARAHVAQTANSTLTMLYWQVGARRHLHPGAGALRIASSYV